MGNHIIKEDNLEVYTPEIGESQEIGIDQTTTSYSPRLNKLKEGETIQVKLNEKAIKWRISHDLYKDFKSGVRELFQNEARACRQARDKYNAKPKIVVKINSDTKSLSIKGIDSLGISEAVFDNVLRVLGVSGNTDGGNEVGQFGMGFASYTTISDIIMVETWYRENREDGSEQRYAFLGDNGVDFKILPEPELDVFGTNISMTYNDTVDERGMIDMLTECAKFCGVKVDLIVESDWNTHHEFGQIGVYELETFRDIEDCLDKQLVSILETEEVYKDGEFNSDTNSKVSYCKKVHIDNEDYEFVGLIALTSSDDSHNNFINGKMNYHLLATVPIEINFSPSGRWTCYALNIKNERKFMPTADRDRLTKEAENAITDMYDNEITEYFKDVKVESIVDYKNSLDKPILDMHNYYEDLIDKDVYEQTSLVLSTLSKRFTINSGTKRMMMLKTMLSSDRDVVKLKALRGDYMQRLNTVLNEPLYFRFKESDVYHYNSDEGKKEYDDMLVLLKEVGVIFGEEYIKENKIKPLTKKEKNKGEAVANKDRPIRLWNGGYRSHHADEEGERAFGLSNYYRRSYISTTIGQVNERAHDNMIQFPKGKTELFNEIKSLLWSTEAPMVLMKEAKGLDSEKIQTWDSFVADVKENELTFLTGKKIIPNKLSKDKDYSIIVADVEGVIPLIKKLNSKEYDNVIAVDNHLGEFKLRCLFDQLGFKLAYSNISTEDIIRQASGLDDDFHMYCNSQQKDYIYGQLPKYQEQLSPSLFKLLLRALASKPYEFDEIIALVKEQIK